MKSIVSSRKHLSTTRGREHTAHMATTMLDKQAKSRDKER